MSNTILPTPEEIARRQRILIYLETYWSQHPEFNWNLLVGDLWFLDEEQVESVLVRYIT